MIESNVSKTQKEILEKIFDKIDYNKNHGKVDEEGKELIEKLITWSKKN